MEAAAVAQAVDVNPDELPTINDPPEVVPDDTDEREATSSPWGTVTPWGTTNPGPLPYLDGERTPNLPTATGSLHGLTRANATPENLARAVVEGMLLGLADAVERVREVGCSLDRVLLIGGASASQAVQDIAPDLFGVPVAIPAPGEYVAAGAARQAAWALSGAEAAPRWEVDIDVTVEPGGSADRARGTEVRERYAAIVASTFPGAR